MEYPIQTARPVYDLGRWFEQAWNVFKAHIWEFVGLIAVVIAPAMVLGFIYGLAMSLAGGFGTHGHPQPLPLAWRAEALLAFALANSAVSTPLLVGAAAVVLGVLRTGVFEWNHLWAGFSKWYDSFAIGLIGSVANSLPGLFPLLWILLPVWLAVMLWSAFATYSLSEPGARLGSSIGKAIDLIRCNFWWGILFIFVAFVVSFLGAFACCIGVFFTAAFYQVLIGTAYNDLTRQMAPAPVEPEA
jgi:hypothetical protein